MKNASRSNRKLEAITYKTIVVGIDIAKSRQWARFVDYRGMEIGKAVSFNNDREGFEYIVSEIRTKIKTFDAEKVFVGMEPTGHYWKPLANYLMKQNITVVLVNPYHTKKSKELDDNSQTKSDKKDALTIAKLVKDQENIVGIKEASGNFTNILRTLELVGGPDKIDLYSGNDDQIVPVMSLGGKGVISVLSNVAPRRTHEMCQAMLDGDVKKAAAMQIEAAELIRQLFIEVNPIPVKAAMSMMGFCENYMRLPLVPMEEKNRQRLLELMREAGLPV